MKKKKKANPSYPTLNTAGKVALNEGKLALKLNSKPLLDHFLYSHAREGDDVSLRLILKRPRRSEAQNNFYWLYLDLISLSSGHTKDELHSYVKEHILGGGISEVLGENTRVTGSTRELNMSEFCEMMNTLEERTGIPIPDPGPFNLPLTHDEYGRLKVIQKQKYGVMSSKV